MFQITKQKSDAGADERAKLIQLLESFVNELKDTRSSD